MSTTTATTRRPRRAKQDPTIVTVGAAAPTDVADTVEQPTTIASIAMPVAVPVPPKAALILVLLGRPEGASLQQLVEATGWLPHTTRAALTGLKRKGHIIVSDKPDGVRIYRVTGGAA